MSSAPGRRAGIVILLVLLLLVPVLAVLPSGPGAVRLAGVSLLWWYAGLAAPLAAVALTIGIEVGGSDRRSPRHPPPVSGGDHQLVEGAGGTRARID